MKSITTRTTMIPVLAVGLLVTLAAGCADTNLADLKVTSADKVGTFKVIDGM